MVKSPALADGSSGVYAGAWRKYDDGSPFNDGRIGDPAEGPLLRLGSFPGPLGVALTRTVRRAGRQAR